VTELELEHSASALASEAHQSSNQATLGTCASRSSSFATSSSVASFAKRSRLASFSEKCYASTIRKFMGRTPWKPYL
jgi:hypothetical protein